MQEKIVIVGGGTMGRAFAHGLLQSKTITPSNLVIAHPSVRAVQDLWHRGVSVVENNREAIKDADIIILAVKPQIVAAVLEEIGSSLPQKALLISIAAGISLDTLQGLMPQRQSTVRVMPNLCAKIGQSMSVWVKGNDVSTRHTEVTRKILLSVGEECELKQESHIDIATAISGSGPAYLFYVAELLQVKSQELGLSAEISRQLIRQTFLGSALMLKQETTSAAELRKSVTSKGGTTEAAFREFDKAKLARVLSMGIDAAAKRARELDREIKKKYV